MNTTGDTLDPPCQHTGQKLADSAVTGSKNDFDNVQAFFAEIVCCIDACCKDLFRDVVGPFVFVGILKEDFDVREDQLEKEEDLDYARG